MSPVAPSFPASTGGLGGAQDPDATAVSLDRPALVGTPIREEMELSQESGSQPRKG